MKSTSTVWANFDSAPDSAVVSLNDAVQIANRSRASFYRDNKDGKLPLIKIGCSTKVRVGDLRQYLAGGVV